MVHVETSMGGRGYARERQYCKLDRFKADRDMDLKDLADPEAGYTYPDKTMKIDVRSGIDLGDKHEVSKNSCAYSLARKDVSLAGSRKRAQPTKMLALGMRNGGSRVCNILFALALLWTATSANSNDGVHHRKTGQPLSPDCWDLLKYDFYNRCPRRDDTDPLDLERVETLCCTPLESNPVDEKLKFHCQFIDNGDGTDTLFPACLEEQTVLRGYFGKLDEDSRKIPFLRQVPCQDGFFAPFNRSSVTEMYPFCQLRLTKCNTQNGETVFCLGDTIADTRCRCKTGYSPSAPDCDRAFDKNSMCKSSCRANNTASYCEGAVPLCSSLSSDQFLISGGCSNFDPSDTGSGHTAQISTPGPSSTGAKQPTKPIDDGGVTPQQPDVPIDGGSDSDLSPGSVAGIVIGCVILAVIIAVAATYFQMKFDVYQHVRDYFCRISSQSPAASYHVARDNSP